ncbi:hypothetical protein CPT_Metamorpho_096 [Klebsiella phage Metamorpho]|nr:hypothetical protein CPT_Metamorpho_096 [Klebsiella phage Metamorpho]
MALNILVKPEIYTDFTKVLNDKSKTIDLSLLKSAFPTYKESWDYFTGASEKEYEYYKGIRYALLLAQNELYTNIQNIQSSVNNAQVGDFNEDVNDFFEWLVKCGFKDAVYSNKSSGSFKFYFSKTPIAPELSPDKSFGEKIRLMVQDNNSAVTDKYEIDPPIEFSWNEAAQSELYDIRYLIELQASTAKSMSEISVIPNSSASGRSEEQVRYMSEKILNWAVSSGFTNATVEVFEQTTYPVGWKYKLTLG